MKRLSALVLFRGAYGCCAAGCESAAGDYRVTKTLAIGGDDGWDYVGVDSAARHVYVSHGTHVVVLDADSGKVVGDIPDTQGVHGIAIAADAGRGFTSNGRANTVTVFDLKTLKTEATVKAGTNPDAIVYDPATKRVFTMNGRSQDTTAINVADNTVAGTLALGGKPEFAVADGKGNIYVNIEDKSELVHFDSKTLKILNRWPMAPCQEPSGLAADWKSRRLFAGCDNKLMAVISADDGKVVATVPIGDGVDANAFDPETQPGVCLDRRRKSNDRSRRWTRQIHNVLRPSRRKSPRARWGWISRRIKFFFLRPISILRPPASAAAK